MLACAALLPDLVIAAASLASPAPLRGEGLDCLAGMGQDNAEGQVLRPTRCGRGKAKQDREEILASPRGFAKG